MIDISASGVSSGGDSQTLIIYRITFPSYSTSPLMTWPFLVVAMIGSQHGCTLLYWRCINNLKGSIDEVVVTLKCLPPSTIGSCRRSLSAEADGRLGSRRGSWRSRHSTTSFYTPARTAQCRMLIFKIRGAVCCGCIMSIRVDRVGCSCHEDRPVYSHHVDPNLTLTEPNGSVLPHLLIWVLPVCRAASRILPTGNMRLAELYLPRPYGANVRPHFSNDPDTAQPFSLAWAFTSARWRNFFSLTRGKGPEGKLLARRKTGRSLASCYVGFPEAAMGVRFGLWH